jgi:uroporphyrinogen-III synthase
MTIICAGVRFSLPHLTVAEYWQDAQLVALGRSTQEELQKLTTKVVFTSEAPTPAGVLEAIRRALHCIALHSADFYYIFSY